SEYAHHIVAEILPFRDLFSSLFFISIGMLVKPGLLAGTLPAVGVWLLVALLVKAAVAIGAVRLLGYPLRIAMAVGISVSQVGEFSFVLASVGQSRGLLSALQSQQFLAVAIVSLALTPFLIPLGAWVGTRVRAQGAALPDPGAGAAAGGSGTTARMS